MLCPKILHYLTTNGGTDILLGIGVDFIGTAVEEICSRFLSLQKLHLYKTDSVISDPFIG